MRYFQIDLKAEFPALADSRTAMLTCYVNTDYAVNEPLRRHPAILIIPGGGYEFVCQSREGEPVALHYLQAGFSAFVLDYSVRPCRYPRQLEEAAAAMATIRRHAEEWHIDQEKIAVCGFSAGGHLAASLGVFFREPRVLDDLGVSAAQIRPDAMILSYPVISADPAICHLGSIVNVAGTADTEDPVYRKMSLENYVTEDTPPSYLWHTADDDVVPVQNSLLFVRQLRKKAVPCELHIFPSGPHGLATADYASNPMPVPHYAAAWKAETLKFLRWLWTEK